MNKTILAPIWIGLVSFTFFIPGSLQAQGVCSAEQLGRALTVDIEHLRRVVHEGPSEGASEGRTLEAFFDGSDIRVVRITYFGETGNLVTTYYITSPTRYAIAYTRSQYNRPIYAGDVEVASQVKQYFYLCDGSFVGIDLGETAVDFQNQLEEALRLLTNP